MISALIDIQRVRQHITVASPRSGTTCAPALPCSASLSRPGRTRPGERLEQTYRLLLGDVTLGELPVPCWLPLRNVEQYRPAHLGPDTHPELPAARAVRMAVAWPLAERDLAAAWRRRPE